MKYDTARGIRAIAIGLFILDLIPLPFAFMGTNATGALTGYLISLSVMIGIIIISQLFVTRYKYQKNTTDSRKRAEGVYGAIALSVIGLFLIGILYIIWTGRHH